MERLTLNRRPKLGERTECLPAGDGLPIWTTIPLDAKLPMMQNPKGSVVLFTTKLGDPKHRCKQEYDFDLRDPNGQYICNEYQPLHDPHLKAHFNSVMMRRHLIRKGFISDDGKILCSLKEFNQYRQYLRHIFFLEIARERKDQLEEQHQQKSRERHNEMERKPSQGTVVRSRLQQQREAQLAKLRKDIDTKTARLDQRLKAIRAEMAQREQKQREEAERRQMAVYKNQQETEQRNLVLMKRWKQRERMRLRLLQEREDQSRLQAEMKCLEKWNTRKKAQQEKLQRDEVFLRQEEEERMKNISRREKIIAKQRQLLEEKIETLKQKTRDEMQQKNEAYARRFEKLTTADFRSWRKRKDKKGSTHTRRFNSTWKLEDVLKSFEFPEVKKEPTKSSGDEMPRIEESTSDFTVDEEVMLLTRAKEIVNGVIQRVKSEILPVSFEHYEECEATMSRSVRFSSEKQEIRVDSSSESVAEQLPYGETLHFRPVEEHILTPCASQLEIQRLEAEALMGSPVTEATSTASFVEKLLLRLLDDLNRGRLSRDDIMKLAGYSMEIIQSAEAEIMKDSLIAEASEESDGEGPYLAASSSSILAKKLVDFTLSKILDEVQSGHVHHDDLASLTVSLLDSAAARDASPSISVSEAELDAYIDDTLRAATSSALDPRDDSPVCDALLDEFMINTLKKLIQDLEEEALTKNQVETLAMSVHEETRRHMQTETEASLESSKDIQNVLIDILAQIQTGSIDMQTLYQIVFSIVYSYNMIIAPPTSFFENKVTELMRELFDTVEQRAREEHVDSVNVNILHEARSRLSHHTLSVETIEKISSCIISVVSQPEISCRTSTSEIARSIVEEALHKAQTSLKADRLDKTMAQSIQNVAESVITNLDDSSRMDVSDSPSLGEVFVQFLECLQAMVKDTGDIGGFSDTELNELITQITCRTLPIDLVEEMATSVVRILKSPVKSESSLTASVVVKNVLQKVQQDLVNGAVEDSIISEMVETLKTCFRAAQLNDSKSPSLLYSLSSFLRSLLNHVTYKVECGEFDESDIAELSKALKENVDKSSTFVRQVSKEECLARGKSAEAKDKTTSTHDGEFIEHSLKDTTEEITYLKDAKSILEHLNVLLCEIESEALDDATAKDLAKKLIDCGNRLLTSMADHTAVIKTPGTDSLAGDVVEEVIRTLQLEIDKGMLSNDSLKEVTKVLMSTKSDSDIASELVGYTLKGIHRDVQRGYDLRQIPSIPTLSQSPSASTIASHIVGQTLEMINKEIQAKGINKDMLSSIASSVISLISDDSDLHGDFGKVRKTVKKVIECLKDDRISQREAEKIFQIILDKYKMYVIGSGHDITASMSQEHLATEDSDLVDTLIKETLKNIERSVAKGRMAGKQFSIPSLPHSDDSSVIAERLIEACFDGMKHDVALESTMPTWPTPDIVDFILEILTKMKEELLAGNVTDLSMAHFFQAISQEPSNLKELESKATENLMKVIMHVQQHRANSVYVHRILETYLSADHTQDCLYSDPIKAIESILVSVSSDILTKFVKATIQNILMEIRDGSPSVVQKPTSVYVLRSATSVIAENVIKEVISRIKADMAASVHHLHGNVSTQELERAASRLLSESPKDDRAEEQERPHTQSKLSLSSIMSKEVEDLVLETLHNIVSNLRLEQSMQAHKDHSGPAKDDESDMSQEIQDFVLQMLQNIVTEQQDRRSHADLEPVKHAKLHFASSAELLSAESREATNYVNEVLQTVICDMKLELANKTVTDNSNEADLTDDFNLEAIIMGNLQNAISGCTLPLCEYSLENAQKDEVKRILISSITGTISNIRQGKFDQDNLLSLYNALVRFIDKEDTASQTVEKVSEDDVIDLMENVLIIVETMGMDNETLNKIAAHLATLGMESDRKTPSTHDSITSVSSSQISDLVRDVLVKVSRQLAEEKQEQESVKSSVKNKNFNRRLSSSSLATTSSDTSALDAKSGSLLERPATIGKRKPQSGKSPDKCTTKSEGKFNKSKSPRGKKSHRSTESRSSPDKHTTKSEEKFYKPKSSQHKTLSRLTESGSSSDKHTTISEEKFYKPMSTQDKKLSGITESVSSPVKHTTKSEEKFYKPKSSQHKTLSGLTESRSSPDKHTTKSEEKFSKTKSQQGKTSFRLTKSNRSTEQQPVKNSTSKSPCSQTSKVKQKDTNEKTTEGSQLGQPSFMVNSDNNRRKKPVNTPATIKKPSTPKSAIIVKSSNSERQALQPHTDQDEIKSSPIHVSCSSLISKASTIQKSSTSTQKQRPISGKEEDRSKTPMSSGVSPKPPEVAPNYTESPLELKSLCGVHKTKIHLRGVVPTPENNDYSRETIESRGSDPLL